MVNVCAVRSPSQRGFTLMELMITVAIVGILAAVALPNYRDYVTRGKLIDATTKLGDFRSKMEKYFMDNRRYSNAPGSGLCGIPNAAAGKPDYFNITCVAPLDTTYVITATGNLATGMPANTWTYTVDQTNAKASTGPAGWAPGVGCWAIRKDGSC